jgi:hypothetical protein
VLLTSIISSLWPGGGGSPRSGQRLATSAVPANSPTPAEMVVWTTSFRIEVISAVSGHVIQTLATNVALYRYMPHPTVSLRHRFLRQSPPQARGAPAGKNGPIYIAVIYSTSPSTDCG